MLHKIKYFSLITISLLFFLSLTMTALAAPPPTARRLIQYKTEGGLYGYMDISGKVVIEPQFDYAHEFIEGLALVSQKGKYGYIDETRAWVIPLQFKNARDFVDGLALVDTGVGKNSTAYIDKTGKIVIPSGEIYYGSSFHEGFAMISVKHKWGFIDKTGQVVIQPQYDKAEDFSEGLAVVITAGKIGYIDVTGKMVIAPQFDAAHSFSEGLAQVSLNQKVGFIDKTGKMVIQLQTDLAGDFHEGLAWLSIDDKVGYMDKMGQIVIQPQFVYAPYAYNFSEGLASVKIGDRYGYIDKTGQMVIPPVFKWVGMFEHGLGFVLNEMSEGYIDTKGNIIIQATLPEYSRPHTQIIPFIPALPTKTQAGTCSTHSLIVNQPFAWRCTTDDNMLHDPCLLAGDGKTLVCDADPTQSHSGFAVTLAKPLPTPTPPTLGPKLTRKVLENTTYLLYDMELMTATLKDGRFEEKYGTDESEKITYTLLDEMGYGDINGDGLEDAVVVLVMDGGGSGKFKYLVAVINDNGQPKQVATSLLGDRVIINSVTIYNQSITVDVITQGPGESFPSPTLPLTVQYVLQGRNLQEQDAPQ